MAEPATIIVGIGASAGGLDAFHGFFHNMPSDSGMAFVVILHLPANRKSMLPEILGRWTSMPVVEAVDATRLDANCVYVPPPHAITTVRDGYLWVHLPPVDAARDERPIDSFFDSMASHLRQNAFGIVLSGTGTDGALGLKAIRECGGFTLAQGGSGSEPQFGGMPSGAIATGAVDVVAAVEAMPAHLLRQAAIANGPELLADNPEEHESARLTICAILRAQIGHDFSGYKDKTFLRRVQRRMHVLNLETFHQYVSRLQQDHAEVVMLFRDLLIRVTSFFRDADTFTVLEAEVVPRLFQGMQADHTVRVWVAGCATGEEACSLAMLMREHIGQKNGAPKVQIFATDIDEPALETARAGRYPATLLEGLSPARRARFFTASGSSYVVAKEIREICTFSAHSLVRDPPFSRMNLISCRNLLIYLDTDLQARVIPAFHYSLVPRGLLLLGSSETTARHEELFTPVNKAARIFERRDVKGPRLDILRQGQPEKASEPPKGTNPPAGSRPKATVRLSEDHQLPGAPNVTPLPPRGPIKIIAKQAARGLRSGLQALSHRIYPVLRDAEELQRQLIETQDQLQSITEEHSTASAIPSFRLCNLRDE